MKKISFILVIAIFLFTSCDNNDVKSNRRIIDYNISQDSIKLKKSFINEDVNRIPLDIYTSNGSRKIYFKPNASDSMYIFEYTDVPLLSEVMQMPKMYRDSSVYGKQYGDVLSLKVISKDSIIMAEHNRISIYNPLHDSVLYKFEIKDSLRWTYTERSPVLYNKKRKEIYTHYIEAADDFMSRIIGRLDVDKDKYIPFPFQLKEEECRVSLFNFCWYFTFSDKGVFYANSLNPKVRLYDFNKEKVTDTIVMGSKKYHKNTEFNTKITNDAIDENYRKNVFYSHILFDQLNEIYIRVMYVPGDEYTDDGLLNLNNQNVLIVMFDENYKFIGEFEFENKGCSAISWIVENGILYGLYMHNYKCLLIKQINYIIK